MKKYISYLLTLALVVPAFVSCTEQLEDLRSNNQKTHTVYFSTTDPATKTGLTIEDNLVKPDWRETDLDNIHFFEIDAADAAAPGIADEISLSADNRTAHFKAAINEKVTINVGGETSQDTGNKSRVSPFTFAAVVAQRPDESAFTFVIPSEQHPDAETLKDPNAEFLVGYSRRSYDAQYDYDSEVVDLYFDRVAALGRLAISGFIGTGEKVKSVTITATGGMTGKATYPGDFTLGDKNKVNFTKVDEPLVLNYGDGVSAPAEGTFYAYFVAAPGEATVTSIEVLTDQYRYSKTVAQGAKFTFSDAQLLNIDFALSEDIAEAVTADNNTWYKASVLEAGYDYIIVSAGQALKNNDGATAGVSVTDNEGVITLEAADPTIVWTAAAHTEMTGSGSSDVVAGHFTITNEGYYLQRNSEEILLATTIPSDKPKYVVWDYDGSYLKHESSGTMTFYCYYDGGWATGYTQNGAAPGSSIKTVQIYTSRAPQELAFTPAANAEYDLAKNEWTVAVPTLSGAQTSVSYALSEDSNPAVATVDGDGTVHPLSKGTVTIVATATGNDQYQAASASYTLRVVDSSVTTKTYIKVTSTSDLEVGAKYLLVFEGLAGDTDGDGNPKVFKPILNGNTFSKATGNALDVEIESGTITSDEFEGSHLTLESGYYLKADAVNRYLYPTGSSSGSGTLSAEATATNKLTIAFDNGIAQIKVNSGSNYLVWSTSSHYFSSNAQVSGSYSTGICLYKLDDGRQLQSPSFSPAKVNYDMAGSAALEKPTLSNAFGDVTYSSSDETIATVDPSSGEVTVKKAGTVEIIATAAGNSQYKPGSASYTLEITNSDAPETYYVLITSEPANWDGTYLIVNTAADGAGYAMNGTGTASVTISGGKILSTPEVDSYALTVTSAGEVHPNQTSSSQGLIAYDINFYDGDWLYWYSSTYKQTSETLSTRHNKCTLYYNNDGVRLMSAGYNVNLNGGSITAPSKNYLYYSSNKFTMSSSHADDRVQLYVRDDSRQPQTFSFNPTEATYDLYAPSSFVKPELSIAYGAVTYSSSNESIAEVDDSGNITGKKKGTVTITATAAGDTQHKPGSASYTLTVENSDPSAPTVPVYTKVTSSADLVAGAKYLLVYESGSKVFKPTLNGSNFATTGNALDVSITDETIVSDEYEDCQMTLEDGYYFYVASVSRYLYPTYNNMGAEETKSSSHSFNISISNGTATITRTSNNTTYNLRYSSSSSYFQASSSSANVALYKLENP